MGKLASLLGGPLKWVASLGTAVVSGLVFWLLSLVGLRDGVTDPLLFGFVVAAVAKFVGWFIATYGPKPTNPVPTP